VKIAKKLNSKRAQSQKAKKQQRQGIFFCDTLEVLLPKFSRTVIR